VVHIQSIQQAETIGVRLLIQGMDFASHGVMDYTEDVAPGTYHFTLILANYPKI
jgi:hypothetical protein